MSKVAILSNINMDAIAKKLESKHEVYMPDGFGAVAGELLNPSSKLQEFAPEFLFVFYDLDAMLSSFENYDEMVAEMTSQLSMIEAALSKDNMKNTICYITDAVLRRNALDIGLRLAQAKSITFAWDAKLMEMTENNKNIFVFDYSSMAQQIGNADFFTEKLWYMGRIIHGAKGRSAIIEEIEHCIIEQQAVGRKKLLVLDLDNTLWGGICGEGEVTLSDEHTGLIYKDLQRVIKRMKDVGVILAIASKNNEADAYEVIDNNPHMILKRDDFSAVRINWNNKDLSIREMVADLNIGLDSVVFLDDNPTERELVSTMLTQVTVIDFPERIEELPATMERVYLEYFKKAVYTVEDAKKTDQYAANRKRKELESSATSFEDYIASLDINLNRVDARANIDRVAELLQKTNQMNVTTRRHTKNDLLSMIDGGHYDFYVYDVTDKFGDNGITAVSIVGDTATAEEIDLAKNEVYIDTFLMSCRIMGRNIENQILDLIATEQKEKGKKAIVGEYIKTAKNAPAADLYLKNGFEAVGGYCFKKNL